MTLDELEKEFNNNVGLDYRISLIKYIESLNKWKQSNPNDPLMSQCDQYIDKFTQTLGNYLAGSISLS